MIEEYGWNISDIKKKKAYVVQRLRRVKDSSEKERLMHSLLNYIKMLDNNGSFYNLRFTKIADMLTRGKFSLIRERKYVKIGDVLFDFKDYVYDDDFLIALSENMSQNTRNVKDDLTHLDFTLQELSDISQDFYKWLGDKEIYEYVREMLNQKNHIQLQDNMIQMNDFGMVSGITYSDVVFDESYISMVLEHNLFDTQVFNHEVMHTVDFKMNKRLPSMNYYGFHEVPTYTIDYLFLDYLEESGYDLEEVTKLRNKKENYIKSLASFTLLKMKIRAGGIGARAVSLEDLKGVMDDEIRKNLLEVQSGVMAYLLAKQIRENKEAGLTNLKKFMKTNIPIDRVPDFSYIGISNQDILNASKEIGNRDLKEESGQEKDRTWNDEKEQKVLFDKVQKIMDKIGKIKLELDKNTNGQVNIGNIGITFNNKIIELLQVYSKNNVTFYNSKLKNVILFYLEDIMFEALNELQNYINLFDVKVKKIGTSKQAQDLSSKSKPMLSKYAELRQKLFDFSIDKDIIKAILKYIEFNKENALSGGFDYYSNNPTNIILDYNKELKELGINVEIPLDIFNYEEKYDNKFQSSNGSKISK